MIACYDLEDNLVTIFDSYKECAEWFDTSVRAIRLYIYKREKNLIDRIKDKKEGRWYRLYKVED